MKNKKKDGNLGDPARGHTDPGSVAVYTMDWPGLVICMYVCVGTVSYRLGGPTDPLVVAQGIAVCLFTLFKTSIRACCMPCHGHVLP